MGLPCSHLIRDLTCPANGDHTDLQLLLQSLAQQYQFWPSHQQAAAHTQLEELSSAPPDVLENPEYQAICRKLGNLSV
ncbi:14011_t:CDS:2 [Entrophospora sp. SA101]|nr:14011_t:CDS:2 [Entrophospora sp. SA101]